MRTGASLIVREMGVAKKASKPAIFPDAMLNPFTMDFKEKKKSEIELRDRASRIETAVSTNPEHFRIAPIEDKKKKLGIGA